ncbi:MAG TPA: peptidase [Ignavibacteriales bacterium]|nr:peptidase [Ignavibacteriales bacterium]
MKFFSVICLAAAIALLGGCAQKEKEKEKTDMQKKIEQFADVDIKYDPSPLTERERTAVQKLYEASKIMDEIFLDQVYSKNKEISSKLALSSKGGDNLNFKYFQIMAGPFDRLDHNKPFYGMDAKPLGANFYPEDMTKEEFNAWIEQHPNDKEKFTSEFTVIRRDSAGLKAVPYSEFYKEQLGRAAQKLREAAEYIDNPSLKKYVTLRAKAFETNDYYESDMAWMDLKDHNIEFIIGPYEVYEDEMFNYKASFESFLTIKDAEESKKLEVIAAHLQDIESNLPYENKNKGFRRGLESPIMVVNEVFSAGDTKAGVQTLAFNLPNDERVRQAKGSKKVMLKNVHEAKFDILLYPIAKIVLPEEYLKDVTFDAFFSHTLMHEMSHGVGPGLITVNGKQTEVKKELKETYSKLEECKADILGMYNNIYMIDKGLYQKGYEKQIYATFLAGIFRSVRFGIGEAHGAANAIIYNFLLEKGAYEYDAANKKVKINEEKIFPAVKELAHVILTIEANGDYNGSKELISKYAVESPSMKELTAQLVSLPTDIRPNFEIDKM